MPQDSTSRPVPQDLSLRLHRSRLGDMGHVQRHSAQQRHTRRCPNGHVGTHTDTGTRAQNHAGPRGDRRTDVRATHVPTHAKGPGAHVMLPTSRARRGRGPGGLSVLQPRLAGSAKAG